MPDKIRGGCLCGDVSFEIKNEFKLFHMCHCHQCQKISGSAHVSNLFIRKDAINWLSGENLVQRFDVPGRRIASAFCQKCGAPVPYLSGGRTLIVPAGSLEGEPNIGPQDHIFMAESRQWHHDIGSVDCFDRYTE